MEIFFFHLLIMAFLSQSNQSKFAMEITIKLQNAMAFQNIKILFFSL
jgi:hypothetical protein